jgi:hypothetical protein
VGCGNKNLLWFSLGVLVDVSKSHFYHPQQKGCLKLV